MTDLYYLAATVAAMALCFLYLIACERL